MKLFSIIFRWKRHGIMILSIFYKYLKEPIFGHKRHQNKSKCKKKKTQFNIFHVKTNNVKQIQVIFRLNYLKNWDFELFLLKKCPKSQIWDFSQKIFCAIFKRPKNMFLWWKRGTFIEALGGNRPKWAYLAQNGQKRPKS